MSHRPAATLPFHDALPDTDSSPRAKPTRLERAATDLADAWPCTTSASGSYRVFSQDPLWTR